MIARVALAAVLTVGLLLFFSVLIGQHDGRSLLDLSPQASAAYQERLELEHAETLARIEARREGTEGVLLLLGVLGIAAIVGAVVVGVQRNRPVTLSLPPHIEPDRIEAFWQEQDRIMEVRGYLAEPRR